MLFFALHHARQTDFRRGKKLGIGDHQVVWHKPKQCPKHMSESEFAALPSTLMVREVCLRLTRQGNRSPDHYRGHYATRCQTLHGSLTQLYGLRWQAAEVNLRHLKTTLKMEMLTAKTPAMVRKEIWTHLFAYTPYANSDVGGNWVLRPHAFSTLTPSRKTAVQSNGPATGNDGKIHSEATVLSSEKRKLQPTCCLFDLIALNPE